jgi:hypothetical protein
VGGAGRPPCPFAAKTSSWRSRETSALWSAASWLACAERGRRGPQLANCATCSRGQTLHRSQRRRGSKPALVTALVRLGKRSSPGSAPTSWLVRSTAGSQVQGRHCCSRACCHWDLGSSSRPSRSAGEGENAASHRQAGSRDGGGRRGRSRSNPAATNDRLETAEADARLWRIAGRGSVRNCPAVRGKQNLRVAGLPVAGVPSAVVDQGWFPG